MIFDKETAPFYSLLEQRAKMNAREGAKATRTVAQTLAKADQLRNEEADDMTSAFPYWESGVSYAAGEIVTDPANGQNYIVVQSVTAAEHQPPHGDGMLAIYRPIPKLLSDGTFIFIYGQNVFTGDICRDSEGVAWRALKDMLPCVWPPQAGNEWAQQTGGTTDPTEPTDPADPTEPDAPAEWVQPAGAVDAYQTGDVVTHNGKTWVCTVDNNVWEPGVYGWSEVV